MHKKKYIKLNSFIILLLSVFLISSASLFARDEDLNGDKVKKKTEKETKNNSSSILSYDLDFTLQGGQVFNQSLYKVNSPVLGAGIDFKGEFGNSHTIKPEISYSIFGEKFFKPVDRSDHTLDSIDQEANAEVMFKGDKFRFIAGINYDNVYRPSWPDLYQPDPYLYDAAFDPDDAKLEGTDRYSFQMITPSGELIYRFRKHIPIAFETGYTRKISKEDPSFDPNLPGHLAPDNYSKFYGDLSVRNHKSNRFFNYKISNQYYRLNSKDELARDSVTGRTHYLTNPNPLYKEWNNETELELILNIVKLNMRISPFYAYVINKDTFQGYYSYTEHDFGLKIQQKLMKNKLKWSIKGERRLRKYTDDGYGYYSATGAHFPLTDGDVLYKNYWILNLDIGYKIKKSVELFAGYSMKKKDTNYPSYVPGVNPTTDITQPGTKNYDIDFSYTNQRIDAGVRYSI